MVPSDSECGDTSGERFAQLAGRAGGQQTALEQRAFASEAELLRGLAINLAD